MKRHSSFFNIQALTSCISMTLVLVLLGAVVFFVLTAHNLSNQVRENITITMLMSDDASNSSIQQLEKRLKQTKYAKEVHFISKESALKDMTKEMGTDPSEFLGHNPFSASLEVGLNADYANKDSIQQIVQQMRRMPNVVDLSYQQDWVDTINYMINQISLVLLVLAALLLVVSIVLINNTLRLSVYSKRFLIHTMTMVGASWTFIRRPFIWKSTALGLIAALVADGLLGGGIYALLKQEPDLHEVITPDILVIVGATVVLFGILITHLCAYFSVNRFLKMKVQDLYTA